MNELFPVEYYYESGASSPTPCRWIGLSQPNSATEQERIIDVRLISDNKELNVSSK